MYVIAGNEKFSFQHERLFQLAQTLLRNDDRPYKMLMAIVNIAF